jgi:hypothetical protein
MFNDETIIQKLNKEIIDNSHISNFNREDLLHYLNVGEFEITFQYLMMEIMEKKKDGIKLYMSPKEAIEIGLSLKLDSDSHMMDYYEPNWWQRFMSYIQTLETKI